MASNNFRKGKGVSADPYEPHHEPFPFECAFCGCVLEGGIICDDCYVEQLVWEENYQEVGWRLMVELDGLEGDDDE